MWKYIIAGLITLVLVLGYTVKDLSSSNDKLRLDLAAATDAAASSKKALDDLVVSSQKSFEILGQQCKREETLGKAENSTLEQLSKRSPAKVQEKVDHASNGDSGASVLELDPDYVRLLNNAYCDANRDDPYCTP